MFVIPFDIPRSKQAEKRRINRELHRIKARMIHQSFWQHENLNKLVEIALLIRQSGGSAKY
ncbi:MAG: hypothetical protein ACP5O8_00155 [Candidatus Aenigmatarchaeota archaeon]